MKVPSSIVLQILKTLAWLSKNIWHQEFGKYLDYIPHYLLTIITGDLEGNMSTSSSQLLLTFLLLVLFVFSFMRVCSCSSVLARPGFYFSFKLSDYSYSNLIAAEKLLFTQILFRLYLRAFALVLFLLFNISAKKISFYLKKNYTFFPQNLQYTRLIWSKFGWIWLLNRSFGAIC